MDGNLRILIKMNLGLRCSEMWCCIFRKVFSEVLNFKTSKTTDTKTEFLSLEDHSREEQYLQNPKSCIMKVVSLHLLSCIALLTCYVHFDSPLSLMSIILIIQWAPGNIYAKI
jgi:hypothetical protein